MVLWIDFGLSRITLKHERNSRTKNDGCPLVASNPCGRFSTSTACSLQFTGRDWVNMRFVRMTHHFGCPFKRKLLSVMTHEPRYLNTYFAAMLSDWLWNGMVKRIPRCSTMMSSGPAVGFIIDQSSLVVKLFTVVDNGEGQSLWKETQSHLASTGHEQEPPFPPTVHWTALCWCSNWLTNMI